MMRELERRKEGCCVGDPFCSVFPIKLKPSNHFPCLLSRIVYSGLLLCEVFWSLRTVLVVARRRIGDAKRVCRDVYVDVDVDAEGCLIECN